MVDLECRYAEQSAAMDELSAVVAEQQRLIDALRAEVVEQRGRLADLPTAGEDDADTVHAHGALVTNSDLAFDDDAW